MILVIWVRVKSESESEFQIKSHHGFTENAENTYKVGLAGYVLAFRTLLWEFEVCMQTSDRRRQMEDMDGVEGKGTWLLAESLPPSTPKFNGSHIFYIKLQTYI